MALTLGDNFSYQGAKPLDARLNYSTVAAMKAVADATMYDGCMGYCIETDKTYQWKSTNTVDETLGKWREFQAGGGDTTYEAGDGIDISEENEISAHVMTEGDMDDVVTPLPSVGAKYHKYTTEEQIIGEWIDGKPLYQRTFEIQPFTANPDYTQVLISSGVVDKIIGQDGYYDLSWNGGIQVESIPSISGPPQNWAYWFVRVFKQNNGNLVFFYRNADGEARSITGGYVTVWYTKTTD